MTFEVFHPLTIDFYAYFVHNSPRDSSANAKMALIIAKQMQMFQKTLQMLQFKGCLESFAHP